MYSACSSLVDAAAGSPSRASRKLPLSSSRSFLLGGRPIDHSLTTCSTRENAFSDLRIELEPNCVSNEPLKNMLDPETATDAARLCWYSSTVLP